MAIEAGRIYIAKELEMKMTGVGYGEMMNWMSLHIQHVPVLLKSSILAQMSTKKESLHLNPGSILFASSVDLAHPQIPVIIALAVREKHEDDTRT